MSTSNKSRKLLPRARVDDIFLSLTNTDTSITNQQSDTPTVGALDGSTNNDLTPAEATHEKSLKKNDENNVEVYNPESSGKNIDNVGGVPTKVQLKRTRDEGPAGKTPAGEERCDLLQPPHQHSQHVGQSGEGDATSCAAILPLLTLQREQETERDFPFDLRRSQLVARLYELALDQADPETGVLQHDVAQLFLLEDAAKPNLYFYTTDEINNGCADGPSIPFHQLQNLCEELSEILDARLCVTQEIFECMLQEMTNLELAQSLDAILDHLLQAETSWAVDLPIAGPVRIKAANGLALYDSDLFIADSMSHAIFRLRMPGSTNQHGLRSSVGGLYRDGGQLELYAGKLQCPGFRDGPRVNAAQFNGPNGLCVCRRTEQLYVADTRNDAIRAIDLVSGLVQTLTVQSVDYIGLSNPVDLCVVHGDFEYEDGLESDDGSAKSDDDGGGGHNKGAGGSDDEAEDGGKPRLEGIQEEDSAEIELEELREGEDYLANMQKRRLLSDLRRRSARFSLADDGILASGKSSARTSRRTSRAYTSDSMTTTRRTSLNLMERGYDSGTVIDSLRELSNAASYDKLPDLAIACDHSVFLIKRSGTLEMSLVAGNISEYGYKDASKGSDARFSQLRGLCAIRNSVFVADHWNNAVRCINLKTTAVDTVMDFEPNGPLKLVVSDSGFLYALDSDTIHMCNILKICSVQVETVQGDNGSALGTVSFQNLQKQTEVLAQYSNTTFNALGSAEMNGESPSATDGAVVRAAGAVSAAQDGALNLRHTEQDQMNEPEKGKSDSLGALPLLGNSVGGTAERRASGLTAHQPEQGSFAPSQLGATASAKMAAIRRGSNRVTSNLQPKNKGRSDAEQPRSGSFLDANWRTPGSSSKTKANINIAEDAADGDGGSSSSDSTGAGLASGAAGGSGDLRGPAADETVATVETVFQQTASSSASAAVGVPLSAADPSSGSGITDPNKNVVDRGAPVTSSVTEMLRRGSFSDPTILNAPNLPGFNPNNMTNHYPQGHAFNFATSGGPPPPLMIGQHVAPSPSGGSAAGFSVSPSPSASSNATGGTTGPPTLLTSTFGNTLFDPSRTGTVAKPRASGEIALQQKRPSAAPEIPAALRSLVPGATLHPALYQMSAAAASSHQDSSSGSSSTVSGSQFRVSVASSVSDADEPSSYHAKSIKSGGGGGKLNKFGSTAGKAWQKVPLSLNEVIDQLGGGGGRGGASTRNGSSSSRNFLFTGGPILSGANMMNSQGAPLCLAFQDLPQDPNGSDHNKFATVLSDQHPVYNSGGGIAGPSGGARGTGYVSTANASTVGSGQQSRQGSARVSYSQPLLAGPGTKQILSKQQALPPAQAQVDPFSHYGSSREFFAPTRAIVGATAVRAQQASHLLLKSDSPFSKSLNLLHRDPSGDHSFLSSNEDQAGVSPNEVLGEDQCMGAVAQAAPTPSRQNKADIEELQVDLEKTEEELEYQRALQEDLHEFFPGVDLLDHTKSPSNKLLRPGTGAGPTMQCQLQHGSPAGGAGMALMSRRGSALINIRGRTKYGHNLKSTLRDGNRNQRDHREERDDVFQPHARSSADVGGGTTASTGAAATLRDAYGPTSTPGNYLSSSGSQQQHRGSSTIAGSLSVQNRASQLGLPSATGSGPCTDYALVNPPRLSLFVGLSGAPWVLKVSPPKKWWKTDEKTFPRFHAIAVDSRRCLLADSISHQVFVVNHERQTKDRIAGCGKCGFLDGPLDICRLNQPLGLAIDSARGFIYVADAGNNRVRRINLSTGFISTVVGNGSRGCGRNTLDTPYDLQFFSPHFLLITCADNCVRSFDLKRKILTTVLIGS
ncbi:unnamed protein product [Amoebophrya sp. A25]|nr:unnamed protein product [Amoebophrya sp. A25]|eukprot:GSA25T00011295001.1